MRCFVAIELPPAIREKLADLQNQLHDLDQSVRWTRPEQIHLTLKFLGEVPDDQVNDICKLAIATAAKFSPIRLEIAGAGCFPPRGPARVVWAGISGPPAELVTCHRALEQAYADMGFEPEDRAFKPHLTIGRARDQRGSREARALLENFKDFRAGTFTANELIVFQSVLSRSGPTYSALAHAPLSAP